MAITTFAPLGAWLGQTELSHWARAALRGVSWLAPADETLARAGHDLYRALLLTLRGTEGLSLLQPGRFLMPAPGPEPPWTAFFPLPGSSRLAQLLRDRFDAYCRAVRQDMVAPGFGRVDRARCACFRSTRGGGALGH